MNNKKAPMRNTEAIKSFNQIVVQNALYGTPVREFRRFKVVEDLLKDARKNASKGDYNSYSYYKNELSKFILSSCEYEKAHKKLINIGRW